MEKKRKLPARGASRSEQAAKKRNLTPPEAQETAAPTPPPPEEAPRRQPLPTSIQAGRPLPTLDEPQPEDVSSREFQTVQESGVLAESLHRSRLRWISDGLFEKYWTKPVKRKGVVTEDPNNPPKESMAKIGQVTIIIEPHMFEATVFAVKDPKPPKPLPSGEKLSKPMLQYGPPTVLMPPPPLPASAAAAKQQQQQQAALPAAKPAAPPPPADPKPQDQSAEKTTAPVAAAEPAAQAVPSPPLPADAKPAAQPAAPAAEAPKTSAPQATAAAEAPKAESPPAPAPAAKAPATASAPPAAPKPTAAAATPKAATPATAAAGPPPAPPVPKSLPADPIIVTLAERASEDASLRDLMKRVAVGEAKPDELKYFQQVIDEITAEYRKKGGQQVPSADRLYVDNRSVQWFADEVRHILDIILRANPRQRSADLRPPAGSDKLIVQLVKRALDDTKTRDQIRRIADHRATFSDPNDLKAMLDFLKERLAKEASRGQQPTVTVPTGATNGTVAAPSTPTAAHAQATTPQSATAPPASPIQHGGGANTVPQTPQALRSKGPPPNSRSDIAAIVLEFHGGSGDRYMFPRYSIIEQTPGSNHLVASFLIVRRGSPPTAPADAATTTTTVEGGGGAANGEKKDQPPSSAGSLALAAGGDPSLDYYQPVTIRIHCPLNGPPRLMDNITKGVAPVDEVRRYMEDVMDHMTRAEYVLLAMRLPRSATDQHRDGGAAAWEDEAGSSGSGVNGADAARSKGMHHGGSSANSNNNNGGHGFGPAAHSFLAAPRPEALQQPPPPLGGPGGVLWAAKALPPNSSGSALRGAQARAPPPDEDARYRDMIATVNRAPPPEAV